MTTGNDDREPREAGDTSEQPNVSPELQDAIRSIDAIGENAWGKDDDENTSRSGSGTDAPDGAPTQPDQDRI